jgi:hypothetical protein
MAEEIAKHDVAKRAERAACRHAKLELRQRIVEAGGILVELGRDCDDLASSALAEVGFYQHHRGEWRHFGEHRNRKA